MIFSKMKMKSLNIFWHGMREWKHQTLNHFSSCHSSQAQRCLGDFWQPSCDDFDLPQPKRHIQSVLKSYRESITDIQFCETKLTRNSANSINLVRRAGTSLKLKSSRRLDLLILSSISLKILDISLKKKAGKHKKCSNLDSEPLHWPK